MARTPSTSPRRGPKPRRFRTWIACSRAVIGVFSFEGETEASPIAPSEKAAASRTEAIRMRSFMVFPSLC
jgi:hypothetical protein